MDIIKNFSQIKNTVAQTLLNCGRAPDSARLIGVSKKQPLAKIIQLAQAGLYDFGENYVQEWLEKKAALETQHPELAGKLRWHFIGHLQSNKAKLVTGEVELIHTIDSLKLAQKVSQIAQEKNLTQNILLQIKLGDGDEKSGFLPETFLHEATPIFKLANLNCIGLMSIPEPLQPPEKMRPFFQKLKSLLDECHDSGLLSREMQELSMGMSDDYQIAVQEGSTMIRIGSSLFGPRL